MAYRTRVNGVQIFGNNDYIELAKLLPKDELFTDEWFYKAFDFSEGLINEIETRVSENVEKGS